MGQPSFLCDTNQLRHVAVVKSETPLPLGVGYYRRFLFCFPLQNLTPLLDCQYNSYTLRSHTLQTKLRPYQLEAVTEIRMHAAQWAASGKVVESTDEPQKGCVLQMPTGAGKTATFCDLIMGAYNKGKCAIMAVRGKELVHQASERLTREGVPHGIYQGAKTKDTHHRVLVCSIDTMARRGIAPESDLIVLDECHLTHSASYKWFLSNYLNTYKLGVSATPHHKDGMGHIGNKLIYPITINELIHQGFLCGARYFTPYIPDLKGVKKTKGDYNAKELSTKSIKDEDLTASAAKVWDKNLRGISTLAYAVSVEHAEHLARSLADAGARVSTITAKTPDAERASCLDGLQSGGLDVIVSVGVLTTGVDIPSLGAILCCRPTESYNLWIQILGRGTRPFNGKSNFVVYDLSGNLLRHGPIEAEIIADMEGMTEPPKVKIIICEECFATFERLPGVDCCPSCGHDIPAAQKARETGKRIHGLTANDEVVEHVVEPWELEMGQLIKMAKDRGYKKGWIRYRIQEQHGEEVANKAWHRIKVLRKWPVKTKKQQEDQAHFTNSLSNSFW